MILPPRMMQPMPPSPMIFMMMGRLLPPPIDMQQLLSRFRSLDLRVRVLEAERSGAQQALWHHHRAASDSQRLRSLISPWALGFHVL